MAKLRSHWICSFALLFAALPLVAQSQDAAPAPPRTIPEGTTFLVRLDDKLDTAKVKPGKHFKANLAEDLVSPDGTLIPRGSRIIGHVSSVEQGLHARMLISFDEIDTGHGKMPLIATLTGVPGEHGVKQPDEEGEIERQGMTNRHMIEAAAVGAGLGAATGAAAGGGKGAAIGAGAGAAVGGAAGLLTDRNLRLEKGATLEVRLDHPLQIPR
jgi:type IV secretory pathway VirB10-like protein